MAEEIERIYIIPLKRWGFKSSVAAPTAVKQVKHYLRRHMKVGDEDIWIDDSLNKALWSHGKYRIENKIRVRAVKFEDGVVEAYLPELDYKKSRRELLKEEKAKKAPILVKEKEEGEVEPSEIPGAEDYDITPKADGEVKIKKKKTPTKEEEKTTKKEPKKTKKKAKEKEKSEEVKKTKGKKEKSETKKKSKNKGKTSKKSD
ncbi:MAG: 50S ribosomal protein L31e [Candidatus Thermoplasmatota archaeon]|nr:50S ribosomal protein L31e [Candidatus Thermoplasmatota archaeon]